MSYSKTKIEGGQGGKRGHSNMNHWDYTENIKRQAKKLRRMESKRLVRTAVEEQQR